MPITVSIKRVPDVSCPRNVRFWSILLKNSVLKIGGVLFAIYAHFHTLDMREVIGNT